MSDPVSEHIERLVGDAGPGPSGVFSLDLARVEMVFAAAGDDWLHYWLRFAAFYGGDPVEIDWDGRRFELRFSSPGPDLEHLRSLLLHRQRGPRYLALGMLAAAQQGFQQIALEAPQGSLTLEGSPSRLEETRRSRDGVCRVRARRPGRSLPLPDVAGLVLPVLVNGSRLQPCAGQDLRLVLDGVAFPWLESPLLPPGESLDWPVEEARLDARLRQLVRPALEPGQMERLQAHFREQLLAREQLTPEASEWLLLRAAREEACRLLQRLAAPPPAHALAPAYFERRHALLGEPVPAGLWEAWPESAWPTLLEQGLVPFPLPEWLRPTCGRLPGRPTYAYLLRHSWRGEHFDPAFLQALLEGRRDTLGGNVLLAGQLRLLKPAQRPAQAARFCLEFLRATVHGDEARPEWSRLDPAERRQIQELVGHFSGLP